MCGGRNPPEAYDGADIEKDKISEPQFARQSHCMFFTRAHCGSHIVCLRKLLSAFGARLFEVNQIGTLKSRLSAPRSFHAKYRPEPPFAAPYICHREQDSLRW